MPPLIRLMLLFCRHTDARAAPFAIIMPSAFSLRQRHAAAIDAAIRLRCRHAAAAEIRRFRHDCRF